MDMRVDRLLGLNLSSLSELRINAHDDDKRCAVLDLALNCNPENVKLRLNLPVTDGIHPVFDHKLMQRVVHLDITFCQ
jgi:hypothetical protein